MFEKILSLKRRSLCVGKQNHPGDDGAVVAEDVRAVATEAALAASLDASPAVLVTLWARDQRLHPEQRGPRRRAG